LAKSSPIVCAVLDNRRHQSRHERAIPISRHPSVMEKTTGPVITDVGPLLGDRVLFSAPFRNSSSSAWRPTSRSSAAIRASPASNLASHTRIRLRQILSLGETIERLAGGELLTDATLELDRVDTVLAHGPYSSRPGTLVNPKTSFCPAPGAHSTLGQSSTPKHSLPNLSSADCPMFDEFLPILTQNGNCLFKVNSVSCSSTGRATAIS